jgi:hypothetical protein
VKAGDFESSMADIPEITQESAIAADFIGVGSLATSNAPVTFSFSNSIGAGTFHFSWPHFPN